jgi:cytochrome c-type biogenesis protein
MGGLTDMAYKWYLLMSQLSAQVGEPLQRLLGSQNIPALSALLLGLLGGLAPCQVTANAGAIAYVTQASQEQKPLWRTVWSFIGGKMIVYVTLGFLAAMLGFRIPTSILAVMRKFSGPLMIVIGLYLFGLIRWRSAGSERVAEWFRDRMPRRGSPAFWLGVAFALGFCPTMAMIFFGALVPLVVQAQAGLALPVIFAVGTAVPVILWALALSVGREAGKRWMRGVRSMDKYVRWGAAAVFVLLGLNDTVLYWLG